MRYRIFAVLITVSLTVVVILQLLNSDVNAVPVNKPFFSVNVSDNWAYVSVKLVDGVDYNSSLLLIPTEFSDFLMNGKGDFQKLFQNVGASSIMTLDSAYLFRNVPLEIYSPSHINQSGGDKILSKENSTIDGERALKIHKTARTNLTNIYESMTYYTIHDGNPYYLTYYAKVKDFQKYLPQFEQMVKTFKFAK